MKSTIQKLAVEETEVRERFKALIKSLPESAEGVTMLGSNCCSVPMSLIREHGFNWSPRYWLCAEAMKALTDMVDMCSSMESLYKNIERVIKEGKVGCGKQYAVPPNIITALKEIWED